MDGALGDQALPDHGIDGLAVIETGSNDNGPLALCRRQCEKRRRNGLSALFQAGQAVATGVGDLDDAALGADILQGLRRPAGVGAFNRVAQLAILLAQNGL